MELSRRLLLVSGVGAGLVAGCSDAPGSSRSGATVGPSSPAATTSPVSPGTVVPDASVLPAVGRWQPDGNDVEPDCKRAAARHVEQEGNRRGQVLQVVFAQYGGLLADSASVLVVSRWWRLHRDRLVAGGRTFDVRLSRHGVRWRVTAVHPSRPGRRAVLTPHARRVLASDRVDLPPAARADVASGQVHDSVLTALLTLAGSFRVGVSVVRSGHPTYVFGTTRLSDHPQGRAFDTWRVNGHEVVDARTPRSLVTDYMRAVAAVGSYNVGGPYLLGAAPQWFSDQTHHDHVHAGFLA